MQLLCYPVKGCSGVAMQEAELTLAGLKNDRIFMVVDEEGVYRTQRRDPLLARIIPSIELGGQRLTLQFPGAGDVDVDVRTSGPQCEVNLFGAPFRGIDQGNAVAGWLTEILGAPRRLVRVPQDHKRVTDGRIPGTSGFADSSAIHLLSQTTLDSLNARITDRGKAPAPTDRFRPNIVVGGWADPHTEDRAHRIVIGDAELGYAKLAIRCAVTMVDQQSGTRDGPEPLRSLADYRRAPGGGVALGTKMAVLRPGKLSVGDDVSVRLWGEPEL
ncbi:MOSC domain-containing protein [Streptomyces sp. 3211]|uniref:MOSC domain-containing protein n=1 Tax=Streptomyces sp. 3211 TaxID=1964449 RepID=UPI0009A54DFD|nr:MOSC N-terminal beta barrel domain-containing protein [Streptomyces sp. 3211]